MVSSSAALAAYLARIGTSLPLEFLTMQELAASFDLSSLSSSATPFDAASLLELNRRVLHRSNFAAVSDRLPSGATETFWLAVRGSLDLLNEARGWWNVVAGSIVPPVIAGEHRTLAKALELLPPEPWNASVCATWLAMLSEATGRETKALLPPLRLALTGEERGPELDALLPLIGRARAANRLQIAAA